MPNAWAPLYTFVANFAVESLPFSSLFIIMFPFSPPSATKLGSRIAKVCNRGGETLTFELSRHSFLNSETSKVLMHFWSRECHDFADWSALHETSTASLNHSTEDTIFSCFARNALYRVPIFQSRQKNLATINVVFDPNLDPAFIILANRNNSYSTVIISGG